MKILKRIGIGLGLVFAAFQFYPNELPEVMVDNKNDLLASGLVDEEISGLLKTSCYNCHSNQTQYPWYSFVAPVSWLVAYDVKEGRKELNFSEWNTYPTRRKLKKLEEIGEEVGEGNMPLPIYTLMHPGSKLSKEQKKLIVQWSGKLSGTLLPP